MKHRWVLVVAFVLAGAILPGVSQATTVIREGNKAAIADFVNTDGCIETDVFLTVARYLQDLHPEVLLSVFQHNTCTGETLFYASVDGLTFPESVFKVTGSSATFRGTITLTDQSDNDIPVTVDVTWRASEPVTVANETFHSHVPGCFANIHSQYKTHLATAAGTITLGSTNVIPNPSTYARIQSADQGSVEFGCDG